MRIVFEAVVFGTVVAAAALALRSETRSYEASCILELTGAVLSTEESKLHGASDVGGAAVRMIERLASELAERGRQQGKRVEKLGSEKRCSVKIIGIRQLTLTCRAESTRRAQQRCEGLARETIAMVNALRMLPQGAPLLVGGAPDRRLRVLALGVAAGLFWVLLRLGWRQRAQPAPRSSVSNALHGHKAVASVPPANSEVAVAQHSVSVAPVLMTRDPSEQHAASRPNAGLAAVGSPSAPLALSAVNPSPTPPSASSSKAREPPRAAQLNSSGDVWSARPSRRFVDRPAPEHGSPAGSLRAVPNEVVIDSPAAAVEPQQSDGTVSTIDATAKSRREASGAANPVSTVVVQDAASGWTPAREVVATAPLAELSKFSEVLFRLATRGGVLVRVASGPECERVKSEVAAQLAWMLAERGSARVLLLEADFERPAVQRVMKVEMPPFSGFSQQLHQRATTGTRVGWSVLRCAPALNVLAEGRVRTLGLLDSPEFAIALAELRRYYDIIIADGPVIDTGVDSGTLDGASDSIVYVTTASAAVSATLELIAQVYGDRELLWVIRTTATPEN